MNKIDTFSQEDFVKIVKESVSINEIERKLGYARGGSNSLIRDRCKVLNINLSHLTEQGHKKNLGKKKTKTEDYLKNKVKITSHKLRLRLIEERILERKCVFCNNTHWLGELIPLELHHKDGNKNNNNLKNLEFRCPNCHYFTDTYKSKNVDK